MMLAELLELPLVFLYVCFGVSAAVLIACALTFLLAALPSLIYEYVVDRLERR